MFFFNSNREIKIAHRVLMENIIFFTHSNSQKNLRYDFKTSNIEVMNDLLIRIHESGINMRYLGVIRHYTESNEWSLLLLLEMICRVIKKQANSLLRFELENKRREYGISGCVSQLVNYLNLVLGKSKESEELWNNSILLNLTQYFKKCFKENEFFHDFRSHEENQVNRIWFKQFVFTEENNKILGEEVEIFLFKYITKKLEIKWNISSFDSFSKQSFIYQTEGMILI